MARRNLPPLNGLRAFEATVRLGGFAAAADELGVTRGRGHVRPRLASGLGRKDVEDVLDLGDAYARQCFNRLVRACASVGLRARLRRQTQTAARASGDDHITPVRLTERPTTWRRSLARVFGR